MLYIKVCSETHKKYYVFIVYHFFLWSRSTRFQPAPVGRSRDLTCLSADNHFPCRSYCLISQWTAQSLDYRQTAIIGITFSAIPRPTRLESILQLRRQSFPPRLFTHLYPVHHPHLHSSRPNRNALKKNENRRLRSEERPHRRFLSLAHRALPRPLPPSIPRM